MLRKLSPYWWCQIIGWSVNVAISVFFITTFGKPTQVFFTSLVITCMFGIVVTHLMRHTIFFLRVLEKPLRHQIVYSAILTLVFAAFLGVISETIDYIVGYNPERLRDHSRASRVLFSTFNALWLVLVWNLIYFIYHYVESNRRQQLDTLRLEATVKSLELKTIKSHINPHFIFNALNSIRALVDENPTRARTAITELSNILRSSMQAEKLETVPLQRELDIVKDYLALEQIRFEERLRVEFDIDEETLQQPVPPMMLQTLVENAIKHGISKQIRGGTVRIRSSIVNNYHEIVVQNSGKLLGTVSSEEGFGIRSTQDRLNLLYQGKANFNISNIEGSMVESKIVMPLVQFPTVAA